MTPEQIVAMAKRKGWKLTVEADRVAVKHRPGNPPSKEILTILRLRKDEFRDLLAPATVKESLAVQPSGDSGQLPEPFGNSEELPTHTIHPDGLIVPAGMSRAQVEDFVQGMSESWSIEETFGERRDGDGGNGTAQDLCQSADGSAGGEAG